MRMGGLYISPWHLLICRQRKCFNYYTKYQFTQLNNSLVGLKKIVPAKLLFYVPFCSVLGEHFCRLSKNYSIQIEPSRDSALAFALFVGNPTVGKVSFVQQEIEPKLLPSASIGDKYLAPLFEAQPLVEGEATKEKMLKFIHGASIINIVAHGESDSCCSQP